MIRRRVVRVPASSANLGPGYDCFAAALGIHLELEVEETGGFAVHTDLPVSRTHENLCVRAFATLHPPEDFTFTIRSSIPLSGGLGSSAAAIVAGLLAADHLFELDIDLLERATAIEGHPDNVAAAIHGGFVVCADGVASRFDPPTGLEAIAVVPEQPVRTSDARRALPARVPIEQAVFNVAHGALLTLGLARGDWDLVARGLHDRLHEQRRSHLFPRSYELARNAPALGALGATISGAGPTVLVWCFYEQTGAVVEALRPAVEGWATLLRAPFELQGAYVAAM
ncbi:MAG TPA: homoserine kinase [Solirubrobacteraceae bacterium]